MLSSNQLANLGYVDSLEFSYNANDVATCAMLHFSINKKTIESEIKMDELTKLLKEIVYIARPIKGVLSFHIGISDNNNNNNNDKNEIQIHHSAIYDNPKTLDTIFVKIFDKFVQLSNYATMIESICLTGDSPEEIDECYQSLSRFYVPEKFLVIPSLISRQDLLVDSIGNDAGDGGEIKSYSDKEQLYESNSIIRTMGTWKVKPEVIEDDKKWNELKDAVHKFNTDILKINGVFFVGNALSKETGEFYFTEHYGSIKAVDETSKYVAMYCNELNVSTNSNSTYTYLDILLYCILLHALWCVCSILFVTRLLFPTSTQYTQTSTLIHTHIHTHIHTLSFCANTNTMLL
jgi:hypothetical protein